MGRNRDLTEFERGLIVGARLSGASLAQTARTVGRSRTTVCRVFRDWHTAHKTNPDRSRCGRRRLISDGAQRWLERLVESEGRRPSLTISSITEALNSARPQEKAVSTRTVRRELRRLDFHTSHVSLVPRRRCGLGEPGHEPMSDEENKRAEDAQREEVCRMEQRREGRWPADR